MSLEWILAKHAIFTDFDCDLQQNSAIQHKVCSLEVVLKWKDLLFTFTAQVVSVGSPEDTYDSDFWAKKFMT
jgi:hypothetical protein